MAKADWPPPQIDPDYVVPEPPPAERQYYTLTDEFPRRMGVDDMCRAFGANGRPLARSTFHRYVEQGRFDRFELRPRIGRRAWSGELVARYLRCEAGATRFVTTSTPPKQINRG